MKSWVSFFVLLWGGIYHECVPRYTFIDRKWGQHFTNLPTSEVLSPVSWTASQSKLKGKKLSLLLLCHWIKQYSWWKEAFICICLFAASTPLFEHGLILPGVFWISISTQLQLCSWGTYLQSALLKDVTWLFQKADIHRKIVC